MCFCALGSRKQKKIIVPHLRWPQVPVAMTMMAAVGPTSGRWSTVWVLSGNLISVTLTYNPGECNLYPDFRSQLVPSLTRRAWPANTSILHREHHSLDYHWKLNIWASSSSSLPFSSSSSQWDCAERSRSLSPERHCEARRDMTRLDPCPQRDTDSSWMDERRSRATSRRASGMDRSIHIFIFFTCFRPRRCHAHLQWEAENLQ